MPRIYYKEDNGDGGLDFCNPGEQLPGFSPVSDLDTLRMLHAKRYDGNREDGVDYYNQLQAELYLLIVTGVYSVIQVVTLESHLKALADEIKGGSWLTAQNTISNMAISGIFDQEFKNKVTNDINNYVNENY